MTFSRSTLALFFVASLAACSSSSGSKGGFDSADTGPAPTPTQDSGSDDSTPAFQEDSGLGATDSGSADSASEAAPSGEAGAADGGPPSVSPTMLDFGMVSCGSTGTPQTLTLDNPSHFGLSWTAALGLGPASPFTINPTSGSLGSGQSAQITVTPTPIPSSASTASNGFGDVVTLSFGGTMATVPLVQTAQGAVLSFLPTTLPFGDVPLSSGATTFNFGVLNQGNGQASVTLTLTGDAAFALPSGASTQSLTATPGGTADSSAVFTPTTTTPVTGSIALTTASTDVLCAPLPQALALSGTGTNGAVAVTPASLTFGASGLVPCGSAAPPQNVTIKNTGSAPVTWSSTLEHGSTYYTLSPASGTVQPGATATVAVTPKTVPASSETMPDGLADVVTITTNISGDTPHTIALHETAQGAILSRSANSVSFGNVPEGSTGQQQITFSNTGNVSATVKFTNGDAVFAEGAPLAIAAGAFAQQTVTFSPAAVQSYSDIGIVALSTTSTPLCGPLPGNLTLAGAGITPVISTSTATLNFGSVDCGATGSPMTVTVTNHATSTTMYTAALGKGASSPFTVSPASGSMTAGGNATLTLAPKAIPHAGTVAPNAYGDTLAITTAGGVTVNVALQESANGAVLVFSKTSIAFPTTKVGSTATSAISLKNTGTAVANVTVSASTEFNATPSTGSIAGAGSLALTASFTPLSAQAFTGTLAVGIGPGTVLCGTAPAPVTVTGTGM